MRWMIYMIVSLPFFVLSVFAAPPEGSDPNSPMAEWYHSLQTPDGGSCCSVADCRPVNARQTADGWEIFIDPIMAGNTIISPGIWEPVPPDRVLRRENADGRPIACRFGGRTLCFVPPAGT